jgi:hypothetical protein
MREVVFEVCDGARGSTDVHFVEAESGMHHQRNVGLRHVRADVVFFPDDDALWHPGVAEAVMRVYERDRDGLIGAVCGASAREAPPGVLDASLGSGPGDRPAGYDMAASDRVLHAVQPRRKRTEERLLPDPFIVLGRSQWATRAVPSWLSEENAVLVEYMTGFRMTFRTDVITSIGFDERLAIRDGYPPCEDIDASLAVMHDHLVVGAERAQVYHHKMPGPRSRGYERGFTQVLNRAYVVCKHAPFGSPARRQVMPYSAMKTAIYLAGLTSAYGRQRLLGAATALRHIPALLAATPAQLGERYDDVVDKCLGSRAGVRRAA